MKRVLVTGGCGFIGANFVRMLLRERLDWQVFNVDALTYAGNLANLAEVRDHPRYRFARTDVADRDALEATVTHWELRADAIVHFAAESHVDRSIVGPVEFARTNVMGTVALLELARRWPGCRHVQVSTDEVYGSLSEDAPAFTESSPLNPSSPYAASKAAADVLVQAYHKTYGLSAVITRCSNNYGPYQFPEKLIPLMVIHSLLGKTLPVYGSGRNVRDWLHVSDHCRGVLAALERGVAGEVYHFGGQSERRNLEIVERIADRVAGHRGLITQVADRPGHDWRYAMDIGKSARELGWSPQVELEDGLEATIDWYLTHRGWWEEILSGDYLGHRPTQSIRPEQAP